MMPSCYGFKRLISLDNRLDPSLQGYEAHIIQSAVRKGTGIAFKDSLFLTLVNLSRTYALPMFPFTFRLLIYDSMRGVGM